MGHIFLLEKKRKNKTEAQQNYPPSLWLIVPPFMVILLGNTRFLLKFSPFIPLLCCAVLHLGSIIRENPQAKTNMLQAPFSNF